MRTHKHTTLYRGEARFFYAAVSLVLIALAAYAYFVSASIVHVVMRKEVDTQIAALGTTMGSLEEQYIELQHTLSADIAAQSGFVAAPKKLFVDRTEGTLVLSRN